MMMGFDEAIDAEEWGMRETNNELAGKAGGSGKAAKEAAGKTSTKKATRQRCASASWAILDGCGDRDGTVFAVMPSSLRRTNAIA
ncbi:MAG: hypothetical protein FJ275_14270 [Planctomycetes bacterium]|nr:hypothetical protein [Planctomycetota bacterium]